MKHIFVAILTEFAITLLFWVGGFDFDKRGSTAFFYTFIMIVLPIFAYAISKDTWK